jgi:hypothetical protein
VEQPQSPMQVLVIIQIYPSQKLRNRKQIRAHSTPKSVLVRFRDWLRERSTGRRRRGYVVRYTGEDAGHELRPGLTQPLIYNEPAIASATRAIPSSQVGNHGFGPFSARLREAR